jgi:phosphoglycerate dehydrogenase-like enzyme
MRVAILDDIHRAYGSTAGVRRLQQRAEVKIFDAPFGDAAALRGFDALIANRERTRFTDVLFEQLPDLRIIAQTGNHAYHIDLPAAERRGIVVAKASGGFCTGAGELAIGLAISLMRQIAASHAAVSARRWASSGSDMLDAMLRQSPVPWGCGSCLGAVGPTRPPLPLSARCQWNWMICCELPTWFPSMQPWPWNRAA